MNDIDNDVGMATYALLNDIENWTDLAREEAALPYLIQDVSKIADAIAELLQAIQHIMHERRPQ